MSNLILYFISRTLKIEVRVIFWSLNDSFVIPFLFLHWNRTKPILRLCHDLNISLRILRLVQFLSFLYFSNEMLCESWIHPWSYQSISRLWYVLRIRDCLFYLFSKTIAVFCRCETISDILFIKKYPKYQIGLFVHNHLL